MSSRPPQPALEVLKERLQGLKEAFNSANLKREQHRGALAPHLEQMGAQTVDMGRKKAKKRHATLVSELAKVGRANKLAVDKLETEFPFEW